MIQITLTESKLTKKPGTKSAYVTVSKETNEVTNKQHYLSTNNDTCKWFRRLGGAESKTMSYTCDGYKCTKLISTSPDKENKTIREFTFKFID